MTYKSLIDTLTSIINDNVLVNQFGYGNISDIETPESGAPNYPYVFINPSTVTIESYGSNITLNIIAMDQALDTVSSEIDATSRMLGLIQDILAHFKTTNLYQTIDVGLTVNCTPFKERFKDDVIGVTAIITFEIQEPLESCNTPIQPDPVYAEYVHVTQLVSQTVDPDNGVPFGDVFRFTNEIVDVDGVWNTLRMDTLESGLYKFVMEYSFQFESAPGVTAPPILSYRPTGLPTQYIDATSIEGWPETPSTGVTYNITQTWQGITVDIPSSVYMQYYNTPANEIALLVQPNSSLKIYKAE